MDVEYEMEEGTVALGDVNNELGFFIFVGAGKCIVRKLEILKVQSSDQDWAVLLKLANRPASQIS